MEARRRGCERAFALSESLKTPDVPLPASVVDLNLKRSSYAFLTIAVYQAVESSLVRRVPGEEKTAIAVTKRIMSAVWKTGG